MERRKNGSLPAHRMHAKLRSAWQQLAESKLCFESLRADLLKGMAEANDVFNSMSIPLIRLVGLKVEELADEGRNASVTKYSSLSPELGRVPYSSSSLTICSGMPFSPNEEHWSAVSRASQWLHGYEEGSVKTKAARHIAEFSLLQKQQLRQLVGVVKMVESLVRSQEEAITDRFQDCEKYFESLQQNYIINFKNLHHRVAQTRQQDSRTTHRLHVAEQSYQALMSLAVKLQESGLEGLRKNLHELKAEVEGMVNELASNMCKPLIAFLKEFRAEGMATVISKLRNLVEEMDSAVSTNIKMLSATNAEIVAYAKSLELRLQSQSEELQAISLQEELMRKSVEEKIKSMEALKQALAQKTARELELQTHLDNEVIRVRRLEDELMQKETKLAAALQRFQTAKVQLSQEHCQIAEAFTKSRALCDQLSVVERRLCDTKMAFDNETCPQATKASGIAEKDFAESPQQQLLDSQAEQAFPLKRFLQEEDSVESCITNQRWCQISEVAPANLTLEQKLFEKGLQEAIDLKVNSRMPQERGNDTKVGMDTLQGREFELVKSFARWISQVKDIQSLLETATLQSQDECLTDLLCTYGTVCQTETSEFGNCAGSLFSDISSVTVRLWLPMFLFLARLNNKTPSRINSDYGGNGTVVSDVQIRKQDLKDVVSELQVRLLELNKSSGSLITVAMAIAFENECAGTPTDRHRLAIEASSQEKPESPAQDQGRQTKFLKVGNLPNIAEEEATDSKNGLRREQFELWQVLELAPSIDSKNKEDIVGVDRVADAQKSSMKSSERRSEPLLVLREDLPKTRASPRLARRIHQHRPQTMSPSHLKRQMISRNRNSSNIKLRSGSAFAADQCSTKGQFFAY